MDINNLSPFIRVATESREQTLDISMRCILDYELMSLEEGILDIVYNGKKYQAVPGDILLFHPGVPHSINSIGECHSVTQPHIHFDMLYESNSKDVYVCFKAPGELSREDRELMRKDILGPGKENSPFVSVPDKERFDRYFHDTILAFTYKPPMHEMILKSKMLMLLTMIIPQNFPEFLSSNNERSQLDVRLVKNHIDEHFRENPSLDELSKIFRFNKSYMIRKFEKTYGISPMKYLRGLTMKEAQNLLKTTSVKKTAGELGFSSIYSFSRAFRAHYGIYPTEYVKTEQTNEMSQ